MVFAWVAIGIVVVVLFGSWAWRNVLAVLSPNTTGIRRAISLEDADRLVFGLEGELNQLREETDADFDTPFDKALDWVARSYSDEHVVLAYNYRASPDIVRPDGTLNTYKGSTGDVNKELVVRTGVRRLGDDNNALKDDLGSAQGLVYLVRMIQLVYQDGRLVKTDSPGAIQAMNSDEVTPIRDASDYPDDVLAFSAEFYLLPPGDVTLDWVSRVKMTDANGDGNPDDLGRPVFVRNLAVRR